MPNAQRARLSSEPPGRRRSRSGAGRPGGAGRPRAPCGRRSAAEAFGTARLRRRRRCWVWAATPRRAHGAARRPPGPSAAGLAGVLQGPEATTTPRQALERRA
jgi:hypothetical protein